MYVQMNCVIVDPDANNRQELANFLGRFGIPVVAQMATVDGLSGMLGRSEGPQLVVINLDPNASASLKAVAMAARSDNLSETRSTLWDIEYLR